MSYTQTSGIDWSKISGALEAGTKVLEDPHLKQLSCEIVRLSKANAGQDPGPPCAATVTAGKTGVGLGVAVLPVKALTYQAQHPWFLPAVGASVVGIFVLIGYALGKARKS